MGHIVQKFYWLETFWITSGRKNNGQSFSTGRLLLFLDPMIPCRNYWHNFSHVLSLSYCSNWHGLCYFLLLLWSHPFNCPVYFLCYNFRALSSFEVSFLMFLSVPWFHLVVITLLCLVYKSLLFFVCLLWVSFDVSMSQPCLHPWVLSGILCSSLLFMVLAFFWIWNFLPWEFIELFTWFDSHLL